MTSDQLLRMSAIEANSFSINDYPVVPICGYNLLFENIRVSSASSNNVGIDLQNFYGDNLKIKNYNPVGLPQLHNNVYSYINLPITGWANAEISDCNVTFPTNTSALVALDYYITNVIVSGCTISSPAGSSPVSSIFFNSTANAYSIRLKLSSTIYPSYISPLSYFNSGTVYTNFFDSYGSYPLTGDSSLGIPAALTGTTPALISSFTNGIYITNNAGQVYRVPVY